MNILKKYRTLLGLSAAGCAVAGLSLLFIPLVDPEGASVQRVFAILIAVLFWLGLAVEILFFVLANRQCRVIEQRLVKIGSKSFKGARVGALAFFTCVEGLVADVLAMISLAVLIILIVLKATNDWLFIIFAVIFFFSLNLHCFFNGRNYKYLKEIQKFIKKQGAKKDE